VEADCYWCLCKLLDSIQDHYTFAQPGIQRICFKISEVRFFHFQRKSRVHMTSMRAQLVRRIDDTFHEHLKKEVCYAYNPIRASLLAAAF